MNSLQNLDNQSHHHSMASQISSNPQDIQFHDSHFDPNPPDDFLDQMFSNLPSCSWNDIKSPWDLNPADTSGVFNFDDSAILASQLRQHQISGGDSSTSAAAAAKMMLQQQLLLSIGGGGESGLLQEGEGSANALFNGFGGNLLGAANQTLNQPQAQNYGGAAAAAMNQAPAASGSTGGGAPAQTRQRVRARRGQATDPHSIAERLRRERIAERMKALQELVPNANKTDKASMLDEIIDYVKFLQLQVKVLSMSRLGGAAAVAPLLADTSVDSAAAPDCTRPNTNAAGRTASSNDNLTVTESQVAKLMEEDMGSAMQYLQGKGLCLMPISLATAISTATNHSRNPMIGSVNGQPGLASNGEAPGPSSPSMSVLTVQSTTVGNGGAEGSGKDAASVSKP